MPQQRRMAFDNLRTLMVLCIILLHAACAYASGIPWWHVQDAKSPIFDLILITIDNFALPVLFFVSGVFAPPSLKRHGAAGFIKNKLRRLGLPLLAIAVFYLPTMVYLGYLHRSTAPVTFPAYWSNWMASLADWDFAVITSMEQGAAYADAFSPHHLWFISLLLLFFLGYAALRTSFAAKPAPSMSRLTWMAGLGMFAAFAVLNLLVQDWAWARFGPFLLFQPTRIPIYLGMFLFGVLARPHMDRVRPFPGAWRRWLILFLVAQIAMITASRAFMLVQGPAPLTHALAHALLRSVLAVSAAGLFVNFLTARLNGPSSWRQSLAAASYDLYLWHMPLAVYVQTLLLNAPLPLAAKFLAAALTPVFLLWFLSRGAARIRPWQWAGFMGTVFLAFCLGLA